MLMAVQQKVQKRTAFLDAEQCRYLQFIVRRVGKTMQQSCMEGLASANVPWHQKQNAAA
jgi:hypothetical protein